MFNIAILGCGPTGLFAAHALRQMGARFDIYSKKRRSEMFGAQYLHKPIHGLSKNPPVKMRYLLEGSAEGYREKVYAQEQARVESTSPQDLEGEHWAWDIREAYFKAWDYYQAQVIETPRIDSSWVTAILRSGVYNAVISTVPAPAICSQGHQFNSVEILAVGDAPERGIVAPKCFDCPPNTVICNGDPDEAWYRQSNVFGHRTVEWPYSAGHQKLSMPYDHRLVYEYDEVIDAAVVKKPIDNNCECFAGEPLFRMGRYGRWQKGELAHQAYFETIKMLERPEEKAE